MSNSVFIGDLANADGNDVLKFDGNNSVVLDQDIPLLVGQVVRVDCYINNYGAVSGTKIFDSKTSSNRFDINISIAGVLDERTYCSFKVNGVDTRNVPLREKFTLDIEILESGHNLGTFGARYSLTDGYDGTLRNISIGESCRYICQGDFGSATLTDHSGGGNNGTINGATWVKDKYDQNFATKELYKAQWPIPMEESQAVTFEKDSDYLVATDSYWNPYNQDGVYSFDVLYSGVSNGRMGIYGLEFKLGLTF